MEPSVFEGNSNMFLEALDKVASLHWFLPFSERRFGPRISPNDQGFAPGCHKSIGIVLTPSTVAARLEPTGQK